MNTTSIQAIRTAITSCVPYVILSCGNIGCLCNFLTFTSVELRKSSCGWYFLMSTLFDFLYINFGLFTKLSTDQYGSKLQDTNLAYCRIRTYLTWTLPCIATSFLLFASIDRCFSTSHNAKIRSFSQLKIARRLTCVPIILYSLTTSHQLFYYVLQPTCTSLPGAYTFFLSFYSIIWTSLVLQGSMLVFALITYCNMEKIRQRFANKRKTQETRTNFQLMIITLLQVLCSSILLNIRTAYFAYSRLSINIPKDSRRLAIEALLLDVSNFIFYSNFGKSFFINTLASKFYRQIFRKRLTQLYRRSILPKERIYPMTVIGRTI